MNLIDKANKALKNPIIKKVIHAQDMLCKYSHRWEWELSSDRMKAYCEHKGLSDEVSLENCLC